MSVDDLIDMIMWSSCFKFNSVSNYFQTTLLILAVEFTAIMTNHIVAD